MSNTVLVLLSAGIGAAGAVTAQSIASIFTGRHDTKRFDWERQRQQREWEGQKRDRFLTDRQELYANYRVLAERVWSYADQVIQSAEEGIPASEIQPVPDLGELERLRSLIELMAPPEVTESVRTSYAALLAAMAAARKASLPSDQRRQLADRAIADWWGAHYAMRTDLHGKSAAFGLPDREEPMRPDKPPGRLMPRWRKSLSKIHRSH